MKRLGLSCLLAAALIGSSYVLVRAAGEETDLSELRKQAARLMREGNWKEAYEAFDKLASNPADDPLQVEQDLRHALTCLQRLGRIDEIDGFREKVIATHAKNWRLLQAAAQSYMEIQHYGTIIAGQFQRGSHRGGGRYVNSYERDRVRALQLMVQAMGQARGEKEGGPVAQLYMNLANMLLANRGFAEAWRLQYLTDLTTLPDYEEVSYYGYRGAGRGAPVGPDGNPVFHHLPESWEAAATDGQRWRWALEQVGKQDPARLAEARLHFASFLHHQFGVQTLQEYRWYFSRVREDEGRKDESGPYELHLLGEDETIARLATGIKRFKLPREFDFIRIYKDVADGASLAESALNTLAQIFENRRQYPRAAEYWRESIKRFGPGNDAWKEQRLDQIVGNWGMFGSILTQPAGKGATVQLRFRNGRKVSFEAHEIHVRKLLEDVKAYIKASSGRLDWQQINIGDVGYRLVTQGQQKYLGEKVASWDLELAPAAKHFDKNVTVTTPLQKAGAYLLTARMAEGNTSRIVVWVADTAIVQKPLDNKSYYFVADAVNGKPVAKANVEFFGYWQQWVADDARRGQGHYTLHTRDFAEFTDADGQLILSPDAQQRNYSWMIIATTPEPEGRLAYLGFTGLWHGARYDQEYNATKVFVITDRPVYRPLHAVKFKFWVNQARYDQEGRSAFAGRKFTVWVNDPRGQKVFEKAFTADEYGGFDGEFALEKGATLGMYRIHLPNQLNGGIGGGASFRVEEYKKPEFEVKLEALEKPVMLGEKIAAKIQARYYFGAPVTEAKVHYKVLRSDYSARWYPVCPWDWFYGPGYWWFAYDYDWYPGWREWGCRRPLPWWWWQWHPQKPPELVAEAEVPIGADGTVEVAIDTGVAKELYGDTDHKYEITAEVTDQSRRTIVGSGSVLVARKPFQVYAWVNRGYFRVGDVVEAHFQAQTLDRKPVEGTGELRLLKVTYKPAAAPDALTPVETEVQKWKLDTNAQGGATQQLKASQAGQYRLSYKLTDAAGHAIEGGYVFCVVGEGFDGSEFRFNDIELVTDKREYAPGEKVKLMINTNRAGAAVVLFVRPTNGVYLPPKLLRLSGKSAAEEIEVLKKDMPNFYVEAFTVSGAKVFTESREIVVPPETRVLNVAVKPSAEKYKPGQKAKLALKVTDHTGEPFVGSLVLSVYDKAVEYISGGSNVPEIKEFFWKWRRHHRPQGQSSLDKGGHNLVEPKHIAMQFLGVFGYLLTEELPAGEGGGGQFGGEANRRGGARALQAAQPAAPAAARADREADGAMAKNAEFAAADKAQAEGLGAGGEQPMVEPTVRQKFADTALWVAAVTTQKDGTAEAELTMPENLTTWKARAWAIGEGTRCGEAAAEVVTTKDLILRLQAPRFFVQKDEVVLSANVHNYLKTDKKVQVVLGPLTKFLKATAQTAEKCKVEKVSGVPGVAGYYYWQTVEIPAGGEKRVDWRVTVVEEGQVDITMKALTDEESDAMQMSFPVYIHGMLKTESFCGVIRPEKDSAAVEVKVPAERLPEQSRLEVRYSPTLAMAMVDALPYMVSYPYGCTEQTLNRFLPTVIVQKVLQKMGVNLKEIENKRTNLNAQEIGDAKARAKQWGGVVEPFRNPVFSEEEVADMVKAGLEKLTAMQCSDGGWGWWSGWGEHSYPHTTALVVHGLQIARANEVAIVPGVLQRGVEWLKRYQEQQVVLLKNAATKTKPFKTQADNLDAFVYMVLADEKIDNAEMRDFLYRDRNDLAVYAKAMFGLALHTLGAKQQRDMLIRNIEQFLVNDEENQTAYLKLPGSNWWWCWYGSEYEAQGYYLKLLSATDPKGPTASRLVKYLLNNRKHATYWNSTRDTAVVVEAFADYVRASGEDKPDMTVQVLIDGKQVKQVKIDGENLFSFDGTVVLEGKELTSGAHKIELRRQGKGPLYFNAYLTNFTLEDPITRAGLEIKVNRSYYKLIREDKAVPAEGARGQALRQKVEKYRRERLADLALLKSGELVEIELVIESKNDYEYIMFEDFKPAGFEPLEVRSGYGSNEMGAYMELRDERVTFFVRALARGQHSVSYRMRAEIPGRFSALPTKARAMYAPELKANSDEIKLRVED